MRLYAQTISPVAACTSLNQPSEELVRMWWWGLFTNSKDTIESLWMASSHSHYSFETAVEPCLQSSFSYWFFESFVRGRLYFVVDFLGALPLRIVVLLSR